MKEFSPEQAEELQAYGLEASSPQAQSLLHYLIELTQWNQKLNLISYSDPKELFQHLLDALEPLRDPAVRNISHARAVDVGAGGGFPGLPLSLAKPEWNMTLVDAVKKKQAFLKAMAEKFKLPGPALWARAEELGKDPSHREKYSLAFCRALGRFTTVAELTLPLLSLEGCLLAHRGEEAPQEIQKGREVVKKLGGEIAQCREYRLTNFNKPRYIVRIDKKSPTPSHFPRRNGVPAKRPLQ